MVQNPQGLKSEVIVTSRIKLSIPSLAVINFLFTIDSQT